jgi:hypothetical protein
MVSLPSSGRSAAAVKHRTPWTGTDTQEDAKDHAHRGRGAHELPLSEALESRDISASLRHAVADVSHLVRDPPRVQHEENADRDRDPIDAHGAVLPSGAHHDAVAASSCGTHREPLAPSPGSAASQASRSLRVAIRRCGVSLRLCVRCCWLRLASCG